MTIPEIAARYGRNPVTLRKWARRLFRRVGRDYILTEPEVRELLAAARTTPGRAPKAPLLP